MLEIVRNRRSLVSTTGGYDVLPGADGPDLVSWAGRARAAPSAARILVLPPFQDREEGDGDAIRDPVLGSVRRSTGVATSSDPGAARPSDARTPEGNAI